MKHAKKFFRHYQFILFVLFGLSSLILFLRAQNQQATILQNSSVGNSQLEEDEDELTTNCGGVERWDEKVLTDPLAYTVIFASHPSSVAHLVVITTPTPGTAMPRYQPVEDSVYTINCNITIKKAETDSDFHLVLSNGTKTLIGEIPCSACSSVAVSPYSNLFQRCRNFINANIASGNVSSVSIPAVVVTGVAFVDPPHGQTGAAPNNLELHPILDIHFASSAVAPVAIFNIPNTICAGQSFTLTDNSFNNPTSRNWTLTGGTPSSSTAQSPTITYNTPGTYTITLTSTNANGTSPSFSRVITVGSVPAVPTVNQNSNALTSSTATTYQWFLNGAAISGATSQTYTATANGNYYVVITNASGCTSQSATVAVTTTGVNESAEKIKFNIYPNPAKDHVNIETEDNSRYIIYITNPLGQQVLRKTLLKKLEIDLSGFSKGVYAIEVRNENEIKYHTQKIILE